MLHDAIAINQIIEPGENMAKSNGRTVALLLTSVKSARESPNATSALLRRRREMAQCVDDPAVMATALKRIPLRDLYFFFFLE